MYFYKWNTLIFPWQFPVQNMVTPSHSMCTNKDNIDMLQINIEIKINRLETNKLWYFTQTWLSVNAMHIMLTRSSCKLKCNYKHTTVLLQIVDMYCLLTNNHALLYFYHLGRGRKIMTQYRNTTMLTIGNVKLEESRLFSDPGLYPSTVHNTSLHWSTATANTGPNSPQNNTTALPLFTWEPVYFISEPRFPCLWESGQLAVVM